MRSDRVENVECFTYRRHFSLLFGNIFIASSLFFISALLNAQILPTMMIEDNVQKVEPEMMIV